MRKKELTQERLKEVLNYDEETGLFAWKVAIRKKVSIGDIAGHKHPRGYIRITIDGKQHLAHRLAWLYVNGKLPVNQLDHIDGIKTNNRFKNLREATIAQNLQNISKANANSSTGVLGVYFIKARNKFKSKIVAGGKAKFLGYFDTAEQAHEAYLTAKRELHPFSTL